MKKIVTIIMIIISYSVISVDVYPSVYDRFVHVRNVDLIETDSVVVRSEKNTKINKNRKGLEVGYVAGLVICRDEFGKLYATNSICRGEF